MAIVTLMIKRETAYEVEVPDFALPESMLNFAYNLWFTRGEEEKFTEVGEDVTKVFAEVELGGDLHEKEF